MPRRQVEFLPQYVADLARQDKKPGNLSRVRGVLKGIAEALKPLVAKAIKRLAAKPKEPPVEQEIDWSVGPYPPADLHLYELDLALEREPDQARRLIAKANVGKALRLPEGKAFTAEGLLELMVGRGGGVNCETIVETDGSVTFDGELVHIDNKTVNDLIQWIRNPLTPADLPSENLYIISSNRECEILVPESWALEKVARWRFFFEGFSESTDPKWLEAERIGIELLEKEQGSIEEAFWHSNLPLLLKVRHHHGMGWLYVILEHVTSKPAQLAANRVCERCGWKAPFPAVTEVEPTGREGRSENGKKESVENSRLAVRTIARHLDAKPRWVYKRLATVKDDHQLKEQAARLGLQKEIASERTWILLERCDLGAVCRFLKEDVKPKKY